MKFWVFEVLRNLSENTSTTTLKFLKNDTKAKKTRRHGLNMDRFYFFGWIQRNMGYKKIYGFFRSWRVFTTRHFSNGRERKHVNYNFEILKNDTKAKKTSIAKLVPGCAKSFRCFYPILASFQSSFRSNMVKNAKMNQLIEHVKVKLH